MRRWVEYAGGYSDMVAQRGAPLAGKAVATATDATMAAPLFADAGSAEGRGSSAAPARRRMSFKDKHALDTLPQRIDDLGRNAGKLRQALADPALYGRDPAGFARLSAALAKTEQELAAAEDQWLALEMQREETGA